MLLLLNILFGNLASLQIDLSECDKDDVYQKSRILARTYILYTSNLIYFSKTTQKTLKQRFSGVVDMLIREDDYLERHQLADVEVYAVNHLVNDFIKILEKEISDIID